MVLGRGFILGSTWRAGFRNSGLKRGGSWSWVHFGENMGGPVLGTVVLKEVVLGHGFNFHEDMEGRFFEQWA